MESISRISSMLETARDLTLEAARDAGPRRSTKPLPAAQIKKLLDSRSERDVLDGLRRVIAMQYAQPPQSTVTFFPAVLKTLSHQYPSTRPLVYNYLLHHAEADPDTALLAINTIQKSLSDTNPRVRAMALKTMAGIRVPVISQIVSLAIKKGVSDLSPLVRKAAALACVNCVRLDPGTRPQVEEYLSTLLADKQYYVAGPALQAFMQICPERLDLIHPVYRRLCKMVVDMDEWGQLALLRLMTSYARQCFPRRTKKVKRAATQEERAKDFYEDIEPKAEQEHEFEEVEFVDPDLKLFLESVRPLLQSRNSAVIVAVARAYLYLSPSDYLKHAVGPLIALLRSPQDVQSIALYNLVQVCLHDRSSLVPYFRHFLIRASETLEICQLKIEILTLIFPECGKEIQDLVLTELEHFSKGQDPNLVREAVRAIGRCAQSSNSFTSRRCLSLLLKQIHSADKVLVGEAIEVVRHLIQRSPDGHKKTVIRLAKNLDTLTSPTARASIIWLVGEFAGAELEEGIAVDVLRILVRGYADEDDQVRAQIILLSAKVYLHYLNARRAKQQALDALHNGNSGESTTQEVNNEHPTTHEAEQLPSDDSHPIPLLFEHTMLLARYTPSYDIRDRARAFRALLAVPASTELASLLLLAPKPVPQAPSPSESRKNFALGSASLVIGEAAGVHGVRGHEAIPTWVEEGREPDPRLREDDERVEYGMQGKKVVSAGQMLDEALEADQGCRPPQSGKSGQGKAKTLDDWLDEETEEESSEEEESEEEETDEEESEEEMDEESEEESDEEDERVGLVNRS